MQPNITLVTALGVLLVIGVAASSPQGSGVAYVNGELILQQTPGYAQADSTFQLEYESWRVEIQQLQTALDSAMEAFDQQSFVLPPSARQEKTEELRRMNQELQQRSMELRNRAQRRWEELMQPLRDRIQRVIDGVRAERNLGMIFDVAPPTSNVVAADPALDLTPMIIGRLSGR